MNSRLVRDITGESDAIATGFADQVERFIRALPVPVKDCDFCAVAGQRQRCAAPNATAAACDDANASLQPEGVAVCWLHE
jgi:hypothetical protein